MDFFKKTTEQIKVLFGKISNTQKLIILGVLVVVIGAFAYWISYSSGEGKVLLYKDGLKAADFKRVTSKLDGMQESYSTSDEKYVYVADEEKATQLRAKLGFEGVVKDVKGFELFDNPKFSLTDFDRKVNFYRSVSDKIEQHIEALDDIDNAEVTISFEENKSFYGKEIDDNPITASVSITPATDSDIHENKKKIRGLRDFIAKGVYRLKPENVIILDQVFGTTLTAQIEPTETDEAILTVKQQMKTRDEYIQKYKKQFKDQLAKVFTDDRYQLSINLDLEWNDRESSSHEIKPIILKDPSDKFGQTIVKDKVEVSSSQTDESFKGPSFIPEGPPGVEPNIGPGMKELVDRSSDYTKKSKISNYRSSTEDKIQNPSPAIIKSVNVSVAVDGVWKEVRDEDGNFKLTKEGGIQREYTPVTDAEIKKAKKLLEGAIDRENKEVVVNHFQFDRSKEHQAADEAYREEQARKKLLIAVVISLLAIIILFLLIRAIRKELARRRRLREEEFARQQQLMRERAIEIAEQEGLGMDIPAEDRARLEMQENAIQIARERPEDVAQLIRTWLVED